MPTAVLLGAGFSNWAAKVPVASRLFDFDIRPSVRDAKKLERVRALKELWDDRNTGAASEQFIAHVLEQGLQRDRNALIWYIGRRLSEPFLWYRSYAASGRRRMLAIDESYKKYLPGVAEARRFLEPLSARAGILTTNYDLLIEYALGSRRFNYGEPGEILHGPGAHPRRRAPIALTGPTCLAKLHGSISWDRDVKYTDGRRALTGGALIVAPVPEKTAPRELRHAWDLAARILQAADELVVFGFAFNPYDVAVRQLLASAGRQIKRVELIDIAPPISRAAEIWPTATIVTRRPPALAA